MKNDDEYSSQAKLKLFSLFDEAIKRPTLREWLGWSDDNWKFNNAPKTKIFYELIAGDPSEGTEPIVTNPPNMRTFSKIVGSGKSNVLSRFLEKEISLDQAKRLIEPEPVNVSLKDSTKSYLNDLSKFPAEKLATIQDEEINLLKNVTEKISQTLYIITE